MTAQLLHECLFFLERGPHRHALEMALAERDAYARALEGIASCATQCGCCAMHARVARERLQGMVPRVGLEPTDGEV